MAMNQLPDGRKAVESLIARSAGRRDEVRIGESTVDAGTVIRHLGPLLTEDRRQRIEDAIAGRTYTVVPVIEGLVNSGNIAAVMRTSEGLGYQRLDIIAGSAPYKHSARTTQGAEKWLDVHPWPTPEACCEALRGDGYRIVATHLDERSRPIEAFDFTQPTALVFGNELGGLSDTMLELADATCIIPMSGFVQSFNISVAAAVSLYHARSDRVARQGHHGDLPESERIRLRADFYLRALRNSRDILAEALQRAT